MQQEIVLSLGFLHYSTYHADYTLLSILLVMVLTEHTIQPQACRNLHRHRYPHDVALHFHTDFVSLDQPQFVRLFYQVLVDLLAVLTRLVLPTQHRALMQAKGSYDGLHRTATGQQGNHKHPQCPWRFTSGG
jgi:hypothetical protein